MDCVGRTLLSVQVLTLTCTMWRGRPRPRQSPGTTQLRHLEMDHPSQLAFPLAPSPITMLTANPPWRNSMFKSPFLVAALFAATIALPAAAQDAKKDTPIKPPR